ncbi:DUF6528 family protein [Paenibacillus sp. CC-CFT747]|nr:DUF6528 family protein [Paenibacillus sp. CC-CFT747]
MPGAHGVLWDPERKLLWAVGDDRLAAFSVGGAPHAPVLSRVQEKKLPTLWGHDLSPVFGDTDLLWVTTNSGVYQYKKSTGTWSSRYPGSEQANRGFVKSMGNQPSGAIIQTVPKEGALYAWGTDTADLFLPDRKLVLPETSVYKARIWSPHYQ